VWHSWQSTDGSHILVFWVLDLGQGCHNASSAVCISRSVRWYCWQFLGLAARSNTTVQRLLKNQAVHSDSAWAWYRSNLWSFTAEQQSSQPCILSCQLLSNKLVCKPDTVTVFYRYIFKVLLQQCCSSTERTEIQLVCIALTLQIAPLKSAIKQGYYYCYSHNRFDVNSLVVYKLIIAFSEPQSEM